MIPKSSEIFSDFTNWNIKMYVKVHIKYLKDIFVIPIGKNLIIAKSAKTIKRNVWQSIKNVSIFTCIFDISNFPSPWKQMSALRCNVYLVFILLVWMRADEVKRILGCTIFSYSEINATYNIIAEFPLGCKKKSWFFNTNAVWFSTSYIMP